MYLACEQMMTGVRELQKKNELDDSLMRCTQGLDNPWTYYAREIDNPWTYCARKLDNSWWKIFALELDNSNWELEISL